MTTVYLVRHAESNFNASGETIDDMDTDLSSLGEEQATKLCGNFDLIICSPLRRTRRTLELSQIKYKELHFSSDAREFRQKNCDFMEGEERYDETEEQMMDRITKLKKRLISEAKKGQKVLLVGHYWTLWYLTSYIKEDTMFGLRANNAEIYQHDFNAE